MTYQVGTYVDLRDSQKESVQFAKNTIFAVGTRIVFGPGLKLIRRIPIVFG